jgi:hypothetical protein
LSQSMSLLHMSQFSYFSLTKLRNHVLSFTLNLSPFISSYFVSQFFMLSLKTSLLFFSFLCLSYFS